MGWKRCREEAASGKHRSNETHPLSTSLSDHYFPSIEGRAWLLIYWLPGGNRLMRSLLAEVLTQVLTGAVGGVYD